MAQLTGWQVSAMGKLNQTTSGQLEPQQGSITTALSTNTKRAISSLLPVLQPSGKLFPNPLPDEKILQPATCYMAELDHDKADANPVRWIAIGPIFRNPVQVPPCLVGFQVLEFALCPSS